MGGRRSGGRRCRGRGRLSRSRSGRGRHYDVGNSFNELVELKPDRLLRRSRYYVTYFGDIECVTSKREKCNLISAVGGRLSRSLVAVFLIDESDRIVDVTFGSKEAVHRAAELWEKKTPLKGNFDRITGVIVTPLNGNRIAIRGDAGEHVYEVRPLAERRLTKLSAGDAVVLLVDDENKVTDVAIPPKSSESNER